MKHAIVLIVLGWLVGIGSFWSYAAVSGGWYETQVLSHTDCVVIRSSGSTFGAGTEFISNPDGSCSTRTPRFHVPN